MRQLRLSHSDLDEDYIDEAMRQALEWHEKYVMGNVSPEFDERKDKEYLDGLRTNLVEEPDQDIQELLAILDVEKPKLEEMKETEKVVKKIEEAIKAYMTLQFPKRIRYHSRSYTQENTRLK